MYHKACCLHAIPIEKIPLYQTLGFPLCFDIKTFEKKIYDTQV